MNAGNLTGRNRADVLDDGRTIGEIEDRWHNLLIFADTVDPNIRRQVERGIVDVLTDFELIRVRIIRAISMRMLSDGHKMHAIKQVLEV